MKRDTDNRDFAIILIVIAGALYLSGCATLKDTAKYREAQREKCACPQVWGESW